MSLTRVAEARFDSASAEVLRRFVVAHVVEGLDRLSTDGCEMVRGQVRPLLAARAEPDPGQTAGPEGLETALFAILGQQVSLAAARTFAGRLVRFAGTDRGDGMFSSPSPERIRDAEPEEFRAALGVTRTRARTVQSLATAVAEGLTLEPGADQPATRAAILALPGIGSWTTEYIALRCLGDRDAFPGGDLVLRRQLGVATEREALAEAERWRPARGLAVLHLWTAAVFT